MKRIVAYVGERSRTDHFDVVLCGRASTGRPSQGGAKLRDLKSEGVTWWFETVDHREAVTTTEEWIGAGPPMP